MPPLKWVAADAAAQSSDTQAIRAQRAEPLDADEGRALDHAQRRSRHVG